MRLTVVFALVLVSILVAGCVQNVTDIRDGYNPDGTPVMEGNRSAANDTDEGPDLQQNMNNGTQAPEKKSIFDVYPQTSGAPVLHMYWNEAKTAEIPLDEVNHIGRFGLWEGGITHGPGYKSGLEPATEIEIHTNNKVQPVYALASGTITELKVDNEGVAEITVRYGTDYAGKYCHVANYNKNLTENSRVESGDLLGYTRWFELGDQPSFGFWEFEFNIKINDTARAIPPFDYFDAESKASLEKLPANFGFSGWVVDPNDKEAGWVAYVGKPEAWASGIAFDIIGDDPIEYWTQHGMGFIYNTEWIAENG